MQGICMMPAMPIPTPVITLLLLFLATLSEGSQG